MEPPDGDPSLLKLAIRQQTPLIGRLGALEVALTRCAMGARGRDAPRLAAQAALEPRTPRALLMAGIAFGRDLAKQAVGDVIVAYQVITFEPQQTGATGTVQRGPIVGPGPVLLDRFRNALTWDFWRPDG